ncbi:hypothetical protein [Bifidobacterium callitrichidarum]|uniref:Uncharacterized protein n=1 Tax=Bifidobacterium callitrichidarum TaxID=2052941 RepID=A0A2U2N9D0_9BIFI|nr:hypothetical protein [Bifidobacterium callitrichidarum]PWG65614.1 hypothetical protein DF196_06685 [Bifidobacterium callitrichidarum]
MTAHDRRIPRTSEPDERIIRVLQTLPDNEYREPRTDPNIRFESFADAIGESRTKDGMETS